jgi:hypothetical protein
LLAIANTTDCQAANADLSNRNELEISGHLLSPRTVARNFEKPEYYYQSMEKIRGMTDLRPFKIYLHGKYPPDFAIEAGK